MAQVCTPPFPPGPAFSHSPSHAVSGHGNGFPFAEVISARPRPGLASQGRRLGKRVVAAVSAPGGGSPGEMPPVGPIAAEACPPNCQLQLLWLGSLAGSGLKVSQTSSVVFTFETYWT